MRALFIRLASLPGRPIAERPVRAAAGASLALALALVLVLAAPAAGNVASTIISRCTKGESLGGFSEQAYREALQELPTEVEEYSDCSNLIRRAQLAAAGTSPGAPTPVPAVATPLTAAARSSIKRLHRSGTAPVRVGSQLVRPGIVHADIASAISSLPNPLLAILAFMLACALALAGRAVRNRVHARRSD